MKTFVLFSQHVEIIFCFNVKGYGFLMFVWFYDFNQQNSRLLGQSAFKHEIQTETGSFQ